jgi:hypothetical protein
VLKEIVGVGLVDHTTPLVVTAEPPSEVIFPPEVAVVVEMELTEIVVTVGVTVVEFVIKITSFP